MNTQKKGSFSRWSGNSAEWYEAASKYTRYHEKLKTHIAPYLNPKETCCELACGAGTLARHLAPLTARYIANDIDPSSLEFCSRLQNQEPVANLEFLPGDWRKVLAGKKFDTVIFSYFSAIFSGEIGQTFVEYLTGVRLEKAKELLMCSGMRTAEIAYEVGYKDSHYFSYIFKKVVGCSPKEYRNRG